MTAAQLKSNLAQLGLSGYQAARLLGLSRRTLTRYLNGHSDIPLVVALAVRGLVQAHKR